MKIKDVGEIELIQKIAKMAGKGHPGVLTGIGDDACVIDTSGKEKTVLSADMLVEGVHFDMRYFTAKQLGYKSAAVNISDIAAMGTEPRFVLVSLGLSPDTDKSFVEKLYEGLAECLERFGAVLIGGDTVESEKIIVSVAAAGFAGDYYLTRSGAKPADIVYVSGTLGDSAAGLELLKGNFRSSGDDVDGKLSDAHLMPVPRVELGLELAAIKATSAIDVSDGLGSDLRHICTSSGTGAVIYEDKLPVSRELKRITEENNTDILPLVLSGGEDYELLFTLPHGTQPPEIGVKITEIGKITEEKDIILIGKDGGRKELPAGFKHFA